MQTTIHRVGITGGGTQNQFGGVADAGDGTAGGLITFSVPDNCEPVIYEVSLDVIGTPAANASVGDVEIDIIDLTSGVLAYDGVTTTDPDGSDVTIGDGDGDGDFSATLESWGDGDGDGEGALVLSNITLGSLADNDAITGNSAFSALANKDKPDGGVTAPSYSPIEHTRVGRLKKSSATQQRISWDVGGGLPVGKSDSGTVFALRCVSTTMVGMGTLTVKHGYRYVSG